MVSGVAETVADTSHGAIVQLFSLLSLSRNHTYTLHLLICFIGSNILTVQRLKYNILPSFLFLDTGWTITEGTLCSPHHYFPTSPEVGIDHDVVDH